MHALNLDQDGASSFSCKLHNYNYHLQNIQVILERDK